MSRFTLRFSPRTPFLCMVFVALGLFVGSSLFTGSALAQQGAPGPEWRSYAGDAGSTKYSSLDQINRDNLADLRIAWQWESVDGRFDLDQLREVWAFIPDPADPNGAHRSSSGGEGIVADVNGVIYSAEVGPRGVKRYHRYIDP